MNQFSRRYFLKSGLAAGLLAVTPGQLLAHRAERTTPGQLDKAASEPVLKRHLFAGPVIIKSIELLKAGREYVVRVRSAAGAEGLAISHRGLMPLFYPLFLDRIAPFFLGRDARDLDALLTEVYVHKSTYKMQGQPLWICVASLEFAVLDLLGQIAGKPVGALFGKIVRRDIPLYQANNNRGRSAEESVERMVQKARETAVKAIKFKVGGRMSNPDDPPGRTEALIPLVRETFGDDMVIYADANGSYEPARAIEVGRLLEASNIAFYEEPCPFDHLDQTKEVAAALPIPIAGGEQESSLWNFRWMILHDAVQIVQPDLFYFGGFIRAIRVARMAETAGMSCIPHISGVGLGYLYVLHFASFIPNADLHMEYKGKTEEIPITCDTSSLVSTQGEIRVPSGPGLGVTIDPDVLVRATLVTG